MTPRIFAALAIVGLTALPGIAQDTFPDPGTQIELEGTKWIVAGAGTAQMDYTATGESLAIYLRQQDGWVAVMTFVPDAGTPVSLEPSGPMLWVDGEQQKTFAGNGYLLRTGKDKAYLLLEYDRAAN